MAIEVFNRCEVKYMLTTEDKDALLALLGTYMDSDPFNKDGKTYPISNLYLDTPSDELIIKSLEKPVFKEKIRLRSYGQVSLDDKVFLESKKKFDGVVNKRRTNFILRDVYRYFEDGTIPQNPVEPNGKPLKMNYQVMREIDYIMHFYPLKPKFLFPMTAWLFLKRATRIFA